MIFKGVLAVRLHDEDVEVRTSSDRNPREDQITMGRVHSPRSSVRNKTYALVLLGFSIMHHAVIAPVLNPSHVPVKRCSNNRSVCWLADN